jgi:hypothetical protein
MDVRILVGAAMLFGAPAISGCGIIQEAQPERYPERAAIGAELEPEQAKEVLQELGSNFAYGPGLGDAAVNLGAVVLFPPFGLYLVGNAVLSLSGYEPITVASLLPAEDGAAWSQTYDEAVSGPGRVVAALSGREYRSREVGTQRMQDLVNRIEAAQVQRDTGAGQGGAPQGAPRAVVNR